MKPSPDSGPDTVERFMKAVTTYEFVVTKLGILGRKLRHVHPWFGPMTAHDWHCLAAIHSWVHRRQIERVVKKLTQA